MGTGSADSDGIAIDTRLTKRLARRAADWVLSDADGLLGYEYFCSIDDNVWTWLPKVTRRNGGEFVGLTIAFNSIKQKQKEKKIIFPKTNTTAYIFNPISRSFLPTNSSVCFTFLRIYGHQKDTDKDIRKKNYSCWCFFSVSFSSITINLSAWKFNDFVLKIKKNYSGGSTSLLKYMFFA